MGRSVKKGPYVQDALMTKVSTMNGKNEKRVIKTWARASTIVPDFVGHTFAVHNGNKFGMPATVREIEYDPNRTARIALVEYEDGEKRYILHPKGLSVGDKIISGPGSDSRVGNALPLMEIPLGTDVHNVELKPGKGGQMARSAGTALEVVAKEGDYVTLRMASTETRMIHGNCLATIGTVGNAEHELISHGKAGKSRWLGKRPKVRGEVMNPVDHPHGGRTRGGRNVVDLWGNKEGVKTRNKHRPSQRLIVRGRKRGKATQ